LHHLVEGDTFDFLDLGFGEEGEAEEGIWLGIFGEGAVVGFVTKKLMQQEKKFE
jgi:hypothetical protein